MHLSGFVLPQHLYARDSTAGEVGSAYACKLLCINEALGSVRSRVGDGKV